MASTPDPWAVPRRAVNDGKVEVRHTGGRPDQAGSVHSCLVAPSWQDWPGRVRCSCLRGGQARCRASISRRMSGVKISCIASSIFPPGTTMMFGRDMNESCSIDSR